MLYSFWFTTYLLEGVFFNRQFAFLWLPIVLFFLMTLSLFIWSRLHTVASTEKKIARSLGFMFLYKVCIFSLNNSTLRVYVDRIYHIEQGIIDTKIHHRMLHTLTYTYKLTKERVRTMFFHKKWSPFSHCEFSIYM